MHFQLPLKRDITCHILKNFRPHPRGGEKLFASLRGVIMDEIFSKYGMYYTVLKVIKNANQWNHLFLDLISRTHPKHPGLGCFGWVRISSNP